MTEDYNLHPDLKAKGGEGLDLNIHPSETDYFEYSDVIFPPSNPDFSFATLVFFA